MKKETITEQATCDWCGKEFNPTPDSFVESGFSAFSADDLDPANAWKGDPQPSPPEVDSSNFSSEDIHAMKKQMGLNDDQIKELLATGNVNSGFSCLCDSCLDGDK